ncbi:hypothetical protein BV25DRAFT_1836608 [Artomyces pyxidatus]|uniref:Uncharacterized protein n=1 Tax=Artomyces pyxidatus TaxID=48021 RepID=A0ACB8TBA8_9AGAM|nr:hypothetical protein BV25DRAFT_1836608 [Artomyces pyxidatus]
MADLPTPTSRSLTEPVPVHTKLPSIYDVLRQRLGCEGHDSLLGYDHKSRDLKIIEWPIGEGGRLLHPAEWEHAVVLLPSLWEVFCKGRIGIRLTPLYLKPGLPAKIYLSYSAVQMNTLLRELEAKSEKSTELLFTPFYATDEEGEGSQGSADTNATRPATPPIPPAPKNA